MAGLSRPRCHRIYSTAGTRLQHRIGTSHFPRGNLYHQWHFNGICVGFWADESAAGAGVLQSVQLGSRPRFGSYRIAGIAYHRSGVDAVVAKRVSIAGMM